MSTTDQITTIKNNIYYYIDSIVKSTKNKQNQFYVFEIKMKLVHSATFENFETLLKNELSYVYQNEFKNNLINNILKQITTEKQELCKHIFTDLKINLLECDLENCPQKYKNNEDLKQKWIAAQLGCAMTCIKCNLKTSDIGIKLEIGTNQSSPNEHDLFKLFELCEMNKWSVK